MPLDTASILGPILPIPQEEVLNGQRSVLPWAKQLYASLSDGFVGLVEATRTQLTQLSDDYIAADAVLVADYTTEIGVVATDVLALASRTTTLESQVQTPTTGALARLTVAETTLVTLDGDITAVASSVTTLSATVDTKNRTFRQTTAPTAIQAGDIWIDSDDNNKIYRATAPGSGSWVVTDDSRIASTLATVTNVAQAYATNSGSTARLVWEVAVGTNVATLVQTAASGYADGTWNGSAITLSASYISLAADAINFGNNTTFEDTYNSFYTEDGTYRMRFGGPFPASGDLTLWFGLESVALNSETQANSIFALSLSDGGVYKDGAELVNPVMVSISAAITDISPPYTGTITVTATGGSGSYTYQWIKMADEAGIPATLSNGTTATVTISVSLGAGEDSTGEVQCIVRDSNGATGVTSQSYTFADIS